MGRGKDFIKVNLAERKAKKRRFKFSLPIKGIEKVPDISIYVPILVGLLVGVLALGIWDYRLASQKAVVKAALERRKTEVALLKRKVGDLQRVENELKQLKQKKKIIEELIRRAHRPLKIILAVQDSMPEEVWVSDFKLMGNRISMKGYALNDDVLADFVEKLQEQKSYVSAVRVSRYEGTTVNGVKVRRFYAEVLLK